MHAFFHMFLYRSIHPFIQPFNGPSNQLASCSFVKVRLCSSVIHLSIFSSIRSLLGSNEIYFALRAEQGRLRGLPAMRRESLFWRLFRSQNEAHPPLVPVARMITHVTSRCRTPGALVFPGRAETERCRRQDLWGPLTLRSGGIDGNSCKRCHIPR